MTEYPGLEHQIADAYAAELAATGHPLFTKPGAVTDRYERALRIVGDVIADLQGTPRTAKASDAVHRVLTDIEGEADGLRGAVLASTILFRCALRILSTHTRFDQQEIAVSLHARLWQDMSTAARIGTPQGSALLALDTRRLPVRLTRTQTRVAAALASNLTTDEICAKLRISKKTLENHIGHISDKMGGRGRRGILTSLKAAQALIAVPVVVFSGVLSDGILSLQDLL